VLELNYKVLFASPNRKQDIHRSSETCLNTLFPVHEEDILLLLLHELVEDVDGHGEDDGGVVLCRYCTQGLQVPQLKQAVHTL